MSLPRETVPIRISKANYDKLAVLKRQLGKQRKTRPTYDNFLDAVIPLAEALLNGEEYYAVGTQLHSDPSAAWSHATEEFLASKRKKFPLPKVLLFLGVDDSFEIPKGEV